MKADISLEGTAEDIKQPMIEKHVPLIAEAGRQGRPDRLPAGAVLRAVLLRRAADAWYELVERIPDGPTTEADAGRSPRSTAW